MKTSVLGVLSALLFLVTCNTSVEALNTPFRIYMRANGNTTCHTDPNNYACGRSYAAAVRTLAQVQQILRNYGFDQPNWATLVNANVEVRISPTDGVYYGQTVTWEVTNPHYTITFMPRLDDKNRPVFVGCTNATRAVCDRGYFFLLSKPAPTNIHFKYIRLERYRNGIFLQARPLAGPSNSHNSVYGCYFYQMGAYWTTTPGDSGVGALNLSNSDDNDVENNHFISIRNEDLQDLHMHAIYLSHGSDYNYIARNRFYASVGDALKVRDWCWYNDIEDNVFSKVGNEESAGYGEAYDVDGNDNQDDMGAPDDERSSCANEFRNNVLDGRFDCAGPLAVFTYHNTPNRCPAGVPRVSTSGNTKTSTPCSY